MLRLSLFPRAGVERGGAGRGGVGWSNGQMECEVSQGHPRPISRLLSSPYTTHDLGKAPRSRLLERSLLLDRRSQIDVVLLEDAGL